MDLDKMLKVKARMKDLKVSDLFILYNSMHKCTKITDTKIVFYKYCEYWSKVKSCSLNRPRQSMEFIYIATQPEAIETDLSLTIKDIHNKNISNRTYGKLVKARHIPF